MNTKQISTLQQQLGDRLERDVNLYPFLTMRETVTAGFFTDARTKEELQDAVRAAISAKIPYLIIGGGSNIAPLKKAVDLFVIKNSYSSLRVLKDEKGFVEVEVASGYPMARLVNETVEKGWEGLEYHKGLPGTIGGAIFMNSKWTKPWTYAGDCLLSAHLLSVEGESKKVEREYFKFAYDYSYLQTTGETVIDAVFRFKKADPAVLRERAEMSLQYRKNTQPFGVATAGCFFRNISKDEQETAKLPTTSAGYLIDQSGMKGIAVGAFEVSTKHANFIIHRGDKEGNPADLLQLVNQIKKKVKERFHIELHEEVVTL